MIVCASVIIIGHFDDLPLGVFVYVIRPAPTILHDIKECLGSLPGTLTYLGSTMPEHGTDWNKIATLWAFRSKDRTELQSLHCGAGGYLIPDGACIQI